MHILFSLLALVVILPSALFKMALTELLASNVSIDRRARVAICTLPDSSVLFYGGHTTKSTKRDFLRLQDGILSTDTLKYPGGSALAILLFTRSNTLYAGGGTDSGAQYSTTGFWKRSLTGGAWERIRDLPFLYQNYHHISAGRELLLVADKIDSWDRHSVHTQQVLFRYQPEADTWDSLSRCPVDTRYVTPVYFESDTTIYVLLRSRRGADDTSDKRFFSISKNDLTYSWKELAPFPVQEHLWSVGYYEQGFGYVCGGGHWGASEDAIFRYDVTKNKWSFHKMGPSMSGYYTWKYKGDWYSGFGCTGSLPWDKTRIFKLTGENASPPTK